MKYAVEMGSLAIQKLMGWIETNRQHGDCIRLLLIFFKIRKVG
jgi:hypothetical protein